MIPRGCSKWLTDGVVVRDRGELVTAVGLSGTIRVKEENF